MPCSTTHCSTAALAPAPNTNAFVPAGTIAAARWHYAGTAYDQRGSCGRAPDPGSLVGLSEEKAEKHLGCVHTKSDSATKRITIVFTEPIGGRRFVWHLKLNLAQLFGCSSQSRVTNATHQIWCERSLKVTLPSYL